MEWFISQKFNAKGFGLGARHFHRRLLWVNDLSQIWKGNPKSFCSTILVLFVATSQDV